ncbi:MAG: hypothetical protein CWE10_08995 [Symbiobacterium thermophilum]|uniref:SLH domain-containing protein n=1 Tax=Symbiobacterium thermophilum TaxID=2734 RepID=A0A953I2H7_SYMTR|nr:hypothetical protein [Symbiobacterium thermophilum]
MLHLNTPKSSCQNKRPLSQTPHAAGKALRASWLVPTGVGRGAGWAAAPVQAAARYGLLSGCQDGTFRPADGTNLAEAVTALEPFFDLVSRQATQPGAMSRRRAARIVATRGRTARAVGPCGVTPAPSAGPGGARCSTPEGTPRGSAAGPGPCPGRSRACGCRGSPCRRTSAADALRRSARGLQSARA